MIRIIIVLHLVGFQSNYTDRIQCRKTRTSVYVECTYVYLTPVYQIASSDPDQLAELINDGKIRAIVDVRPENEFENGSLPEAMSIPFYRQIKGWNTGVRKNLYVTFEY